MAVKDRYADGGGADPNGGILQDLPGLPDYLHLLPRVAIVLEPVYLRDAVESDLLRHYVRLDRPFAAQQRDRLLGQLLDGDPSYVTNDEALVKNLGLNFKVVYAGSEPALIQAFRQAEQNHTPLIGYFYEPQWFLNEVPLVKVNLPAYTDGCDADPAKVACDYPKYDLNKIVSTKFANSGSPAYNLVKNFKLTNQDQNVVAGYIAKDGMSPEAAAHKWIDANPDKVAAWLK